jgi:hypothetical protein
MRPWGRPRPRQQHPKQVFRSNIRNPHDIHPASHLLASDLMTYTGEQLFCIVHHIAVRAGHI